MRIEKKITLKRLSIAAVAAIAGSFADPSVARADTASCSTAHATGQREQKAGHLKAASDQFMSCGSDDACPEAIRSNCMERYAALEKLMPSVIFSVVDEQGKDAANVQVFSNDQPIASELDGRPVLLEPGKYKFRFVLPSGGELTTDALIREGEKNRVITVKAPEAAGSAAPVGTTPSVTEPPPTTESKSLSPAFWVASGLTVAALGSFTTFAILGRSKHSDLADCSPDCSRSRASDYDAMKRDYLIADISLGVAAVSAGVAAVVFFTSGSGKEAPPAQAKARIWSPRLTIAPLGAGAGAGLVLSGQTF